MTNWIYKKLVPYALKFREWSRDKLWVQVLMGLLLLWMLGIFNPYWCVYPVCWIQGA